MNNDNSAKYVAFQGERTVDEALKKELRKQMLKSLNEQEFQNSQTSMTILAKKSETQKVCDPDENIKLSMIGVKSKDVIKKKMFSQ